MNKHEPGCKHRAKYSGDDAILCPCHRSASPPPVAASQEVADLIREADVTLARPARADNAALYLSLIRDLANALRSPPIPPELAEVVAHYDHITKDGPAADLEWDFVMTAAEYRVLRQAAVRTQRAASPDLLRNQIETAFGKAYTAATGLVAIGIPGDILRDHARALALALAGQRAAEQQPRGFTQYELNMLESTANWLPESARECIMGDSEFMAGMTLGWNCAVTGDKAKFDAAIDSRIRDRKEARAPHPERAAPGEPVAWIATIGTTVLHMAVKDGWKVEPVLAAPAPATAKEGD